MDKAFGWRTNLFYRINHVAYRNDSDFLMIENPSPEEVSRHLFEDELSSNHSEFKAKLGNYSDETLKNLIYLTALDTPSKFEVERMTRDEMIEKVIEIINDETTYDQHDLNAQEPQPIPEVLYFSVGVIVPGLFDALSLFDLYKIASFWEVPEGARFEMKKLIVEKQKYLFEG